MSQTYKAMKIKQSISKELWNQIKGTAMIEGKTIEQWLAENLPKLLENKKK